jgi:hypothetical protein
MAKIDETNFSTKYEGKIASLQKRIDQIALLKKQRNAWSSQRFISRGKGKKAHTIYVSAFAALDLPPIDLPVDAKFVEDVIGALNTRIVHAEHEIAEAIRELSTQPRRAR